MTIEELIEQKISLSTDILFDFGSDCNVNNPDFVTHCYGWDGESPHCQCQRYPVKWTIDNDKLIPVINLD